MIKYSKWALTGIGKIAIADTKQKVEILYLGTHEDRPLDESEALAIRPTNTFIVMDDTNTTSANGDKVKKLEFIISNVDNKGNNIINTSYNIEFVGLYARYNGDTILLAYTKVVDEAERIYPYDSSNNDTLIRIKYVLWLGVSDDVQIDVKYEINSSYITIGRASELYYNKDEIDNNLFEMNKIINKTKELVFGDQDGVPGGLSKSVADNTTEIESLKNITTEHTSKIRDIDNVNTIQDTNINNLIDQVTELSGPNGTVPNLTLRVEDLENNTPRSSVVNNNLFNNDFEITTSTFNESHIGYLMRTLSNLAQHMDVHKEKAKFKILTKDNYMSLMGLRIRKGGRVYIEYGEMVDNNNGIANGNDIRRQSLFMLTSIDSLFDGVFLDDNTYPTIKEKLSSPERLEVPLYIHFFKNRERIHEVSINTRIDIGQWTNTKKLNADLGSALYNWVTSKSNPLGRPFYHEIDTISITAGNPVNESTDTVETIDNSEFFRSFNELSPFVDTNEETETNVAFTWGKVNDIAKDAKYNIIHQHLIARLYMIYIKDKTLYTSRDKSVILAVMEAKLRTLDDAILKDSEVFGHFMSNVEIYNNIVRTINTNILEKKLIAEDNDRFSINTGSISIVEFYGRFKKQLYKFMINNLYSRGYKVISEADVDRLVTEIDNKIKEFDTKGLIYQPEEGTYSPTGRYVLNIPALTAIGGFTSNSTTTDTDFISYIMDVDPAMVNTVKNSNNFSIYNTAISMLHDNMYEYKGTNLKVSIKNLILNTFFNYRG